MSSIEICPSAPLELITSVEERLENKLTDINSFNNSINNLKEMTTYFKDEYRKSKNKYELYKAYWFSFHSNTISTGIACGLSLTNNAFVKIINKYKGYKRTL